MRSLFESLKSLFSSAPSYEQYLEAANDVKDYENRLRQLGNTNADLIFLRLH